MERTPEFKKDLLLTILMSVVAFLPAEVYVLFKFIVTPNAYWQRFLEAPLWALGGFQLFLLCFWLLAMLIIWKKRAETVRRSPKPKGKRLKGDYLIFAVVSVICFLPFEGYFLIHWLFQPSGFWQNLVLAGFFFWAASSVQFILFIIWLFFLVAFLERR